MGLEISSPGTYSLHLLPVLFSTPLAGALRSQMPIAAKCLMLSPQLIKIQKR